MKKPDELLYSSLGVKRKLFGAGEEDVYFASDSGAWKRNGALLRLDVSSQSASEAVIWLCSNLEGHTMGQTLFVDGGMHEKP